ncbi:MAG: hypothetical protein K2Y16_04825, partial [Burkholderiales bacterium]|nr:hypothetical protein [Burkholderiales bacterium]
PALKTLLAKVDSKAARNAALARAYLEHGHTLTEIGRAAGQSYYQGSRGNVIIQDVTPMSRYVTRARCDPYVSTRCDPYVSM